MRVLLHPLLEEVSQFAVVQPDRIAVSTAIHQQGVFFRIAFASHFLVAVGARDARSVNLFGVRRGEIRQKSWSKIGEAKIRLLQQSVQSLLIVESSLTSGTESYFPVAESYSIHGQSAAWAHRLRLVHEAAFWCR